MLLYLTGANTSLVKSVDNPQTDANKSLGGYFSTTPVPNAALNSLFDIVSSYTAEKRQDETIGIGLMNEFKLGVKNVELKIITEPDNIAVFKVAAVSVSSDDYRMEAISSRYQEPMGAEFYDASFCRASVDLKINQYASAHEEIILYPFNVMVTVDEEGWEGTWKAFKKAFSDNLEYEVVRVSKGTYRIIKHDDTTLEQPLDCSYVATDRFIATFSGKFANAMNNTVLLAERLAPGDAIGIWIQRHIKEDTITSDEQLIEEYKRKNAKKDIEEVEILITYDLVDAEKD